MQERQSPFHNPFSKETGTAKLVLFNDDVNTFDHVIESLMAYCDFSEIRAEQCAWITHLKGKCTVKEGDFKTLKRIAFLLSEEGLSVEVYKE
jgi:ATP-dependent Clp protease adaptor protein ClpS